MAQDDGHGSREHLRTAPEQRGSGEPDRACWASRRARSSRACRIAIFLLLVVAFLAVVFVRQRRASVDIGRIGLIAIPFMFLMPLTHWAYALFCPRGPAPAPLRPVLRARGPATADSCRVCSHRRHAGAFRGATVFCGRTLDRDAALQCLRPGALAAQHLARGTRRCRRAACDPGCFRIESLPVPHVRSARVRRVIRFHEVRI